VRDLSVVQELELASEAKWKPKRRVSVSLLHHSECTSSYLCIRIAQNKHRPVKQCFVLIPGLSKPCHSAHVRRALAKGYCTVYISNEFFYMAETGILLICMLGVCDIDKIIISIFWDYDKVN